MEADIRGIRLHWRESGSGRPLLLIHAFPLSGAIWQPQLDAAPPGWRLIAPDLRGFGDSEADPYGAPLTMDTFADDMAALLDHLSLKDAVVCGLSMGGYTSLALWRRHRQRVRALVLADTRAGADTAEGRAGRMAMADRVQQEGSQAAVEAMLPRFVSDLTRERRPALVQRLEELILATSPTAISRAQHGMAARPDSTPLLRELDVPALVIVGEDDVITPPAEAEKLAEGIPGAQLVRIPGVGHMSNMEDPDAFNQALFEFLHRLA